MEAIKFKSTLKTKIINFLGFEYVRIGDIAHLKFLNIKLWAKIGNKYNSTELNRIRKIFKRKIYIKRIDYENVFLLGKWTESTWEVMGIFPDLKTSLKHLKEEYWVVEIPFNELYSEENMEVISYQIVDGKIWLVDTDGTMLERVDVEKLTM